eukprot:gene7481-biopygen13582
MQNGPVRFSKFTSLSSRVRRSSTSLNSPAAGGRRLAVYGITHCTCERDAMPETVGARVKKVQSRNSYCLTSIVFASHALRMKVRRSRDSRWKARLHPDPTRIICAPGARARGGSHRGSRRKSRGILLRSEEKVEMETPPPATTLRVACPPTPQFQKLPECYPETLVGRGMRRCCDTAITPNKAFCGASIPLARGLLLNQALVFSLFVRQEQRCDEPVLRWRRWELLQFVPSQLDRTIGPKEATRLTPAGEKKTKEAPNGAVPALLLRKYNADKNPGRRESRKKRGGGTTLTIPVDDGCTKNARSPACAATTTAALREATPWEPYPPVHDQAQNYAFRKADPAAARRCTRRPQEPWNLGGAAGPPRTPGIPGSAVSPALVSHGSWSAGLVPARLWKDRSPIFPKTCWNRSGTPRTATDQRRRNRAPGDPGGSVMGGPAAAPRLQRFHSSCGAAGNLCAAVDAAPALSRVKSQEGFSDGGRVRVRAARGRRRRRRGAAAAGGAGAGAAAAPAVAAAAAAAAAAAGAAGVEGPRAGRGERAMYRIAPWFRAEAGDDNTGGGIKFDAIILTDRLETLLNGSARCGTR